MKSKRDRYANIQVQASVLHEQLEEIHSEVATAMDNVPENLQNSDKYYDMEARETALSEQLDNLQEIIDFDWSNPS